MKKIFILLFLVVGLWSLAVADPVDFEFNPQKNELHCVFNHWKRTYEYVYNVISNKMEILQHDSVTKYSDSGNYKFSYDEKKYADGKIHVIETLTNKEVGVISHEWHEMFISPDDAMIMLYSDGGGDYAGLTFYKLPEGTFFAWRHIMSAKFLRQKKLWIFQYELGCEVVDATDWTSLAELEGSPSDSGYGGIDTRPICSYSGKYVAVGKNIYETSSWTKVCEVKKINYYSAFTRDDRHILVPEEDGVHCYSIFDASEKFILNHEKADRYDTIDVFVASNGRIITCNRKLGNVKIWDGNTGAQISFFEVKDPFNFILRGDEAFNSGDFSLAIDYYRKSSEKDEPAGMFKLGKMYYDGTGVEQDYKKAYECFENAFRHNYMQCANILGDMYLNGLGTGKNYEKAFACYEESSKGYGDAAKVAKYKLAYLYENGLGCQLDYIKAKSLYQSVLTLPEAKLAYKNLLEKGLGVTASDYYKEAYSAYNGKNYSEALKWFEKSSKLGNNDATSMLGNMYYNAYGVSRDYVKAREYWEKAALNGDSAATGNLSLLYYYGYGVQVDKAKAKQYLEKAAALGSKWASDKLKSWKFD